MTIRHPYPFLTMQCHVITDHHCHRPGKFHITMPRHDHMGSAIVATSQRAVSAPLDHNFSRYSNKAGAPLPLIPRRINSSIPRHVASFSAPNTPFSSSIPVPAKLVVQPPTPADNANESSPVGDAFPFQRLNCSDSE